MQKRGLLFFIASLFSINFASAYGYYGSSLSDALYFIEPTTIVLMLLFIVFFAFLNWILKRYFKDSPGTAGVISLAISMLMIYGIWWNGFNIDNIFDSWGGLGDFLYTILPIAFLALIIFLIMKFGRNSLLILALILVAVSFFAYEMESLWIIAFILFVIWIFIRKKKDNINSGLPSANTSSPNSSQLSPQANGFPILESEAKAYRKLADRQPNPQLYRNWAQFIGYLKNRGYGGNEKEICRRLNVSSSDIQKVVKRHIN